MTTLIAIKKQIAALQAQAEKITKAEMSGAIAKVKELMSAFGLTAEHLGLTATRGKPTAAKKAAPKRAGAGKPKYADPKSGQTWSGFGRAPKWIASAKNRDVFLVDQSTLSTPDVQAGIATKKATKSTTKGAKPAKKSLSKTSTKAAPTSRVTATAKKAAPKKATSKVAAKKPAAKKRAVRNKAPSNSASESVTTTAQ